MIITLGLVIYKCLLIYIVVQSELDPNDLNLTLENEIIY